MRMSIKWLLLACFIPLMAKSQVATRWYDTKDLFSGNYYKLPATMLDTVQTQYNFYDYWGANQTFYTISTDTTADTLYSRIISNRYGHAEMWVTFGFIQDTAHIGTSRKDTTDVDVDIGLFRGYGFGSSGTTTLQYGALDSLGFEYYNLFTLNVGTAACPDTIMKIALNDSTWWNDYPVTKYFFKITEQDTTKNRYFLNVFQYSEE